MTISTPVREDLPGTSPSLVGRVLSHPSLPMIVSLLAVIVVFQSQSPFFITSRNIINLLVGVTPLVMVALGQIIVILTKEIDLSLGSVAGLTAALCAQQLSSGVPWPAAVLITCVVGMAIGAVQGLIIVYGRIASFVVTLGGYLVLLGLQLQALGATGGIGVFDPVILGLTLNSVPALAAWIIGGVLWVLWAANTYATRRSRSRTGRANDPLRRSLLPLIAVAVAIAVVPIYFGERGIPLSFAIVTAIVAAVALVMTHTPAGRHLYAIGGNLESIRRAGVPVNRLRVGAFVASSFFATLAGVLFVSSDQGAGTLTGGGTLMLQAIGVAVIGGVSLQGGRGSVWAAVLGALVLGGVNNGMDLTNNSSATKYVVQGIVVILVLLIDSIVRRSAVSGGHGRFAWRRRGIGSRGR
ncbi:MAG: inner-rane translocator [Schumannella sp.]|nr:inner-rane translocator [Schumannella sp.]